MTPKSRVTALRLLLKKQRLTGLIIPRQDEFQGEYVAAYAERLRWLTGFAGSWGIAILTLNKGAIFVDGRYTIQVRQQVDTKLFTPHHLVDEPPAAWIAENLKKGDVLGYDPWLLTADQAERFAAACAKVGAKLQALASNPIDTIWEDQPKRPTASLSVQPLQFAGQSVADKLAMIAKLLAKAGADATVLTQPDSVAWAFNIRGHDVPYTPVVLAYAILKKKGKAELFIDKAKLPEDVQAHLKKSVTVRKPAEFESALKALGKSAVQIDGNWAPAKIKLALAKAKIINAVDLCVLPKAKKNKTEQEGARAAHQRDGVAMSRFLCWLESAAPKGGLTEWSEPKSWSSSARTPACCLIFPSTALRAPAPTPPFPTIT